MFGYDNEVSRGLVKKMSKMRYKKTLTDRIN